ncbi:hemin uptake protein HemP [Delftia sp. PS-11]|uniref:hemin uptake protein HemP n=1 Tax=Delftia sp. PS-11 TaxID=2767222 RepID=UPI002454D4FD|nr:hemin uptake protein HemP [Delftia sp. PS-11]KAJ8744233.1 hemin uptake protein HemP [Delftia sp. PS-11]
MSASSAATSHLSGSSSAQAFAAPLAAASAAMHSGAAAGLDSTLLLNGQKAVTIVHNGTPYRLQATKLGKLILTK